MNPADLHDALQYVEEDMLQEVEARRSRKAQRRHRWIQWTAVAACVCIAVVTAVAANHRPLGSPTEDTAPNDSWIDSGTPSEENSALDEDNEILDEEYAAESWALIQIDEWQANGFRGKVIDATGADRLAEGEAVEVWLEAAAPTTNSTLKGEDDYNSETPAFPTGSVVRVWFVIQEVESEKAHTVTRYILYATDITLENAE